MSKKIKNEVMRAYGDCHDAGNPEKRNLDFKATASVNGAEFVSIMSAACPHGYNEFNADAATKVVALFGDDAEYTIGREGSPVVYIKTAKRVWLDRDVLVNRLADEASYEGNGVFRLWWD